MFSPISPAVALKWCAQPSQRAQPVARHIAHWMALGWLGLVAATPVHAQAPAPAKSASAAAAAQAQDRSQDPAYSVFRWIKMHADTPRKPDPAKPAATTAAPPAPRPRPAEATTAATPAPRPTATAPAAEAPAATAPAAATAATAVPEPTAPPTTAPTPTATVAQAAPEAETSTEPEADLKILSQTQPVIPRELRRSTSLGKVVVSFTIQTDGSVAEATPLSYSDRKLGKAAADAVSKWLFEPIRSARTVQVEIAFNAQ